jgi:hypothetical protein
MNCSPLGNNESRPSSVALFSAALLEQKDAFYLSFVSALRRVSFRRHSQGYMIMKH